MEGSILVVLGNGSILIIKRVRRGRWEKKEWVSLSLILKKKRKRFR